MIICYKIKDKYIINEPTIKFNNALFCAPVLISKYKQKSA